MRSPVILAVALACAAAPADSAEVHTAEDVRRCVVEHAPSLSNVQTIRLVSRDRVGAERVVTANIYTRSEAQGLRRILVRFSQPEELDGAAFLLIQREHENELIVRSPDLGSTKRIAREELVGSIAGTDFSYEDFTRFQRLNRPAALRRLADEQLEGRGVYVIESQPADAESSAYKRVRAYVDRETCIVLRSELYEAGDKLRKVMTASPERFRQVGSAWVSDEVLLRDVRDGTQTQLIVESFDIDAEIPAERFSVESLGARELDKPGG